MSVESFTCHLELLSILITHLFVVDLISDSLLIITPLVIFWRVKLPPTQRRLVLIFFCGSVLTLLGATAYVVIANSKTVFSLGMDRPLVNLGVGAVEVIEFH